MEDEPSIADFARRLRELRTGAGSPPYRRLAALTHYSSSTLAEATAGKRLPTEAVVRAFATACGADPEPWVADLHRTAAKAADEALPSVPSPSPAVPTPAGPKPLQQRPFRLRRAALPTAAVALLLLGALIGAAAKPAAHHDPEATPSVTAAAPFSAVPAAPPSAGSTDGMDPAAAGCTSDAVLKDKAPVLLDGTQVGAVDLLFSAHCGSGWARVFLYPAQPTMMAEVTVRSRDGRLSAISGRLEKQMPVYTNVIVPDEGGCLSAEAIVLAPDRAAPVLAQIPCE